MCRLCSDLYTHMSRQSSYESDSITVLEGLEAVQERPGMYIGSTDSSGLHHLVYEVLDNSIDEAMAGYCDHITVEISSDNRVTVTDNGRGIPVDSYGDSGKSTVEVILTTLHAGGKFDSETYDTSGGLHGVGISVVNALSEELEVAVYRDGRKWVQSYAYGKPQTQLIETSSDNDSSGTTISFNPDSNLFETVEFDFETLESRFRELAFLNPAVTIEFIDHRDPQSSVAATATATDETGVEKQTATFHYEGGIKEYVAYLNETRSELHDTIYYTEEQDGISVEVALQSTESVQPAIHSFANNINTREGGTHLTGFKTSFTRVVNRYGEANDLLGDIDGSLTGDDVREGVTAVISIKHPDPQFEGQTKTKLGNSEVSGIVSSITTHALKRFFEENPNIASKLVEKSTRAAKARKAARKAQKLTRRKSALSSTSLPGKLSDCQTKDPSEAELFIVEGDSAGGSGRQGRDPDRQAILPLRGKILNVERHRLNRILENTQIKNLITALGTGIGDEFSLDELRYKNIIILTDADVDGAHIRTLLLTFLYRHMRPLLESGYVYAAKPPLYRVKYNGKTYDAMTEIQKEEIVETKCNGNPTQIQRFKGLGEMNPEQLWNTTMDPDERWLKRITIEDGAYADKMFSVLMGDQVQPRKQFIRENATEAEWVDI